MGTSGERDVVDEWRGCPFNSYGANGCLGESVSSWTRCGASKTFSTAVRYRYRLRVGIYCGWRGVTAKRFLSQKEYQPLNP